MITKTGIKCLDLLPLNKWVRYMDVHGKLTNVGTINALAELGKLEYAIIRLPDTIADEDVERGKMTVVVEKFTSRDRTGNYPHFIKKIDESYQTLDMAVVMTLRNEIEQLREQLKSLEDKKC